MTDDALFTRVDQLLKTQLQGVLATQQHSHPYTSLMAFAHTPDLRYLVIATLRETQKHANLMRNAEVSFLVDNRTNAQIDYEQAVAISVIGHRSCPSHSGCRAWAIPGHLRGQTPETRGLHQRPSLLIAPH